MSPWHRTSHAATRNGHLSLPARNTADMHLPGHKHAICSAALRGLHAALHIPANSNGRMPRSPPRELQPQSGSGHGMMQSDRRRPAAAHPSTAGTHLVDAQMGASAQQGANAHVCALMTSDYVVLNLSVCAMQWLRRHSAHLDRSATALFAPSTRQLCLRQPRPAQHCTTAATTPCSGGVSQSTASCSQAPYDSYDS